MSDTPPIALSIIDRNDRAADALDDWSAQRLADLTAATPSLCGAVVAAHARLMQTNPRGPQWQATYEDFVNTIDDLDHLLEGFRNTAKIQRIALELRARPKLDA